MLSWFTCFDVKSFVKVWKGLSMCTAVFSIPDFGLDEGKSRRRSSIGLDDVGSSSGQVTRPLDEALDEVDRNGPD